MVESSDQNGGDRAEKLSITLPAALAREIRELAGAGGVSAFIAEAARQQLRRQRLVRALEIGFGAWNRSADERTGTFLVLQRLREAGRERAERLRRLVRGEDA